MGSLEPMLLYSLLRNRPSLTVQRGMASFIWDGCTTV